MAARLQTATWSANPILLRVDFDAEHGVGSTRAQRDEELADAYAFVLWQRAGRVPAEGVSPLLRSDQRRISKAFGSSCLARSAACFASASMPSHPYVSAR